MDSKDGEGILERRPGRHKTLYLAVVSGPPPPGPNTLIAPDDGRSPSSVCSPPPRPKELLQGFSPHPCTAQSPGELFFKYQCLGPLSKFGFLWVQLLEVWFYFKAPE